MIHTMLHKRACRRLQENVVSRRCAEEGCRLQPNFNAPGETRGQYCKGHARSGMVCEDCLFLPPGTQLTAKACLVTEKLSTGARCPCRSAKANTTACKSWPLVQCQYVRLQVSVALWAGGWDPQQQRQACAATRKHSSLM